MYSAFVATAALATADAADVVRRTAGYTGSSYSPPAIPGYTMEWKPLPTSIDGLLEIRLTAATTGWVGFGLAEYGAGGMPGSDFVVCQNNAATDYHGFTYGTPTPDASQDWALVSFDTTAGTTVCELTRLLNTRDPQDRPIDLTRFALGDAPVLFAHGANDDASFGYHGAAVTTATLNLVNPTNATAEVLALPE